jgi:hypothetical protein
MEENGTTDEQLTALMEGCGVAKQSVKDAAMRASDALKDALPELPDGDGTGTGE